MFEFLHNVFVFVTVTVVSFVSPEVTVTPTPTITPTPTVTITSVPTKISKSRILPIAPQATPSANPTIILTSEEKAIQVKTEAIKNQKPLTEEEIKSIKKNVKSVTEKHE